MKDANINTNGNSNSYNDTTTTTIPLLINNNPIITRQTFPVTSPLSNTPIHQCASASPSDANQAVSSAHSAFPAWSRTKKAQRQEIMHRAAEIYSRRKDEMLRYWAEESGAGGPFAELVFGMGLGMFREFAALGVEGTVPRLVEEGMSGMVLRVPYGVVLSVVPWNAAFPLTLRAILLPLMAGNTVVVKGSERIPKTVWAICDVFREAGLPARCINLIFHRPEDASQITTALIAHPAVKKVNFTGSSSVGSIVAATAGKHLKPVLMELGGKASSIVLDDADIKKAAESCVLAAFLNAGQICMSTERIVVQRSIADNFRAALNEAMDRMHHASTPPPILVSSAEVERTKQLIEDASSKGAKILVGSLDDNKDKVEYGAAAMRPVILEGVTPEMEIYHTESFGPTVSLFVVETEEEAIALANDTEYGLTAAVFTEDLGRGMRVAREIESGAVHINSMSVHDEPSLPHGGMKKSGYGRFGGSRGLDEFLTTKSVTWMDS